MTSNLDAQSNEGRDEFDAQPIVPWEDYVPGTVVLIPIAYAFIACFFQEGGMIGWAVSREALVEGKIWVLQLHMFAHGSIAHIVMNSLALFSIAALVVQKLGGVRQAWWKFLLIFEVAGIAGALAFLIIHQWNATPMLGASGAIYGLLGFLVRLPDDGESFVPLFSRDMVDVVWQLIKDHFWLFLIFALPPLIAGRSGGVAWEAHAGGFLAGLLLAPYLTSSRVSTK
ncbi:rhomboid family intramembrane serine protease [Croceicoccus sediminis]|uniref:rhomboid family intramembrane serine protease n=1 Tax=Croceicoccus sediminis TaxID=2571150 RepID=UPI00118302C1|nr:rhomboid family intramembrane serine protease [Croceicoccus sediminis]